MKKSAPKEAKNKSPARPTLVALPSPKDSLLSPKFFAEQVKKLYPLDFVETEEIKRGEDPDYTTDPLGAVMRRVARAVEEQPGSAGK